MSTASYAQVDDSVASEQGQAQADGSTIVVTGSRIARTGAQEPTPVTMVAVEDLQKAAPTNIPEALNQLPQFQGSRSATGGADGNVLSNANQPRAGNYLNLRNVGSQRMLVLMDGRRVPPTSFEGIVDTNIIPQGLVQRVDVVTAGASAVYGADAVSGVVNFVLNTKFEGVRGNLQSGITQYGDGANWRASVAAGTSFADGRGHIVASYDYYNNDGVEHKRSRPYLTDPLYFLAGRGTAAEPFRNVSNAHNVGYTTGGLILGASNPAAAAQLANLQFLNANETRPLVIGAPTQQANVKIGGEGAIGIPETVLAAGLKTHQAFAHARYDLTDNVTFFAQSSYTTARNTYATNFDSRTGGTALTIFRENAYIPGHIAQIMDDTGASSFTFGRQLKDFPVNNVDTRTKSWISTAGLEGTAEFVKNGRWEIYYTHGDSRMHTRQVQNENANLFAAVDAVDEGMFRTGTANGNIVCRVTLTNPALMPGCVPVNLFGAGTPSSAAIDYIAGMTEFRVRNKLDEVSANFSGTLFEIWAGDVSFNVGAQYRRQSLSETSNSNPAIPVNYTGGSDPSNPATYTGIRGVPGVGNTNSSIPPKFNFTNVGVAEGWTETKEVYGELVIPLLRDAPFAKYFEINGAGRYTDYRTSGGEVTWKAGAIWEPFDGLRFRGTLSRDIREPTLYDLFAGSQVNPSFYNDRGFTDLNQQTVFISGGNPNLRPEVGHTTALGMVLQPAFLPGFTASVDYYNLRISDAIGSVAPTVIGEQCRISGGTDPLCDMIIRPAPGEFPSAIMQVPVNIASIKTKGVDVDLSYRMPLSRISENMDGVLTLRALSNYLIAYDTNSGGGARTFELAGLVGRSKWRQTMSVSYDTDTLGVFLQGRIVGSAKRDTAGNTGLIYEDNKIGAETYVDMTLDYDVKAGGLSFTPFLTVNNLLNNKAPIIPIAFIPGVVLPTDPGTYDILGRRFTAGVRFQF